MDARDRPPTPRELDVALQIEQAVTAALKEVSKPGTETFIRFYREPVTNPHDLNTRTLITHDPEAFVIREPGLGYHAYPTDLVGAMAGLLVESSRRGWEWPWDVYSAIKAWMMKDPRSRPPI